MESDKPQDQQMSENAVDITPEKDGGVLKEILRAGEGEGSPSAGDNVFVHYVGTLTNGEKFDSSRDRGEKFEFQLGKGKVIKAWDLGVATMKRGELARLTCQANYAYGESGSPPKIPANATLIFEVELFDWKGEDITDDKDGGILKHHIQEGEGYKTPNDGATVNIHYSGKYQGKVFEDREVEFEVGEGADKDVIPGLELIAKNLKKGEKARFDIASDYAYGSKGREQFNIPGGATLEYDVEMKNFEKAKESWEMDTKEKLEQSEIHKSKGTAFFKAANYKSAVSNYKKIVSFLEFEKSLEEEDQTKRDALMLAAHLNLAMCYVKLEDYTDAVAQCEKAIEMDSKSIKAYFRRGQARVQMCDYEAAKKDFEQVLALEPDNKAAKNQMIVCNQKIKQFNDKQKKIYAGMFTKFANQDAKKAKDEGVDGPAEKSAATSDKVTENGDAKSPDQTAEPSGEVEGKPELEQETMETA